MYAEYTLQPASRLDWLYVVLTTETDENDLMGRNSTVKEMKKLEYEMAHPTDEQAKYNDVLG